MRSVATVGLLIAAIVGPIMSYIFLASKTDLGTNLAVTLSVIIGWALNVAWARTINTANRQRFLTIAKRYGWFCPSVLVIFTVVGMYFLGNPSAGP